MSEIKSLPEKTENIFRCIRICAFCFAIFLTFSGVYLGKLNLALSGVAVCHLFMLLYCFERPRRRIVLLLFYIVFWVFLLSRPCIGALRGDEWWWLSQEASRFSIVAMMVSLFCIHFANAFIEKCLSARGYYDKENTSGFYDLRYLDEKDYNISLRFIAFLAFIVCMGFTLAAEGEKLIFMLDKSYEEYYLLFESELPYFVQTVSGFTPYALCLYLATMPKKAGAAFSIILYILSTVPMLLIGARNNIVLALFFGFFYFVFRDYLDGSKKWIGKFERIAIIILLPVGIIFLGAYNYTRAGSSYSSDVFSLIVDFFYKQGVSFNTVVRGYTALPNLPDLVPKNYTFGGFLDYIEHNNLAQSLFGAVDLGTGNSITRAVYGNSFAHSMSFIAHPNYLGGEGWGSSYIIETYADFGYTGVVVFSLLLGVFMTLVIPAMKRSRFLRALLLYCMTSFFLIARAGATEFLTFIIYSRFWFVMVACYFAAAVITKAETPDSALYYSKKKKDGIVYV